MKQQWVQHEVFRFEYPIEDETDPMIEEVKTWLEESCGPMRPEKWVGGIVIHPSNCLRVKPFGSMWRQQVDQHPLWICITFGPSHPSAADVQTNFAMLFKLRWM
jgi:hypothetical protein